MGSLGSSGCFFSAGWWGIGGTGAGAGGSRGASRDPRRRSNSAMRSACSRTSSTCSLMRPLTSTSACTSGTDGPTSTEKFPLGSSLTACF
eukprot:scaffold19436_cov152-Isochrysis_galbana.AAC.3